MVVSSYNGLVNKEDVNQAYSHAENQLQRRVDLIPNLVNTVNVKRTSKRLSILSDVLFLFCFI